MARCLAAAMSQAPGLSGMPDSGHCSRAATSASCASSSATPTSRTMRVRAAMILADSIRQTASMARWVGVDMTAAHHTTFPLGAQATIGNRNSAPAGSLPRKKALLRLGCEVFGPEHLTDLRFALPTGPVFLVELHEAHRALDCLLLRLQFKLRVPADDLFSL